MHVTESSVSSATLRAWSKLQGIECRWFAAEAEAVSAVPDANGNSAITAITSVTGTVEGHML